MQHLIGVLLVCIAKDLSHRKFLFCIKNLQRLLCSLIIFILINSPKTNAAK